MTGRPVLVVATRNPGKAIEIVEALPHVEVRTLDAYPDLTMPEEFGETFLENARLKATFVADALSADAVLADDSGLEVAALDGRPGVRSARWVEGSDEDRTRALLDVMAEVPDGARGARFVCAMTFCGFGSPIGVEGVCEGRITRQARGHNGFGYDPVFELTTGQTMAELSPREKNLVSHRGKALAKIIPLLMSHFAFGH
jgi:XTP/dITP diphosphohydrolase